MRLIKSISYNLFHFFLVAPIIYSLFNGELSNYFIFYSAGFFLLLVILGYKYGAVHSLTGWMFCLLSILVSIVLDNAYSQWEVLILSMALTMGYFVKVDLRNFRVSIIVVFFSMMIFAHFLDKKLLWFLLFDTGIVSGYLIANALENLRRIYKNAIQKNLKGFLEITVIFIMTDLLLGVYFGIVYYKILYQGSATRHFNLSENVSPELFDFALYSFNIVLDGNLSLEIAPHSDFSYILFLIEKFLSIFFTVVYLGLSISSLSTKKNEKY